MANGRRSRPVDRRPNSRDPLPAGGFRFSEVNLNSDPSDNEETVKQPTPINKPSAAQMNQPQGMNQQGTGRQAMPPQGAQGVTRPGMNPVPSQGTNQGLNQGMAWQGMNKPAAANAPPASTAAATAGGLNAAGRPTGIGGLKPLSTGATVQATNIQSTPPTQSQQKGVPTSTVPVSPQIPTADKRSTGGFLPRSAMPPNRQPGGIAMEQKPADLESIGHSMKTQNVRLQEAEQKYGNPVGQLQSPTVAAGGKFSYANPPPPEHRPKETLPPVHRGNQQHDLEANKPESSGNGKKIFLYILVGLLVAGLVAGGIVAIVLTTKAPAPKK